MSKIFKNMIPYWKSIVIIIALLFVQAWCDLSLPSYTSDIIDLRTPSKPKRELHLRFGAEEGSRQDKQPCFARMRSERLSSDAVSCAT